EPEIVRAKVGEICRRRANDDDREPVVCFRSGLCVPLRPEDGREQKRQGQQAAHVAEMQSAGKEISGVGSAHARSKNCAPISDADRGKVFDLHWKTSRAAALGRRHNGLPGLGIACRGTAVTSYRAGLKWPTCSELIQRSRQPSKCGT